MLLKSEQPADQRQRASSRWLCVAANKSAKGKAKKRCVGRKLLRALSSLCLGAQRQPAFGLKQAKKSVEIVRRVTRSRLCRVISSDEQAGELGGDRVVIHTQTMARKRTHRTERLLREEQTTKDGTQS